MKSTIKVISVLLILIFVASFGLAGCGAQAAKTDTAAQEKKVSDELYIEVSAAGSLDYFYDHKLGLKMAGDALGVKTEYVGPANFDMPAMIAALEQSIAKKPKGLVVVGFDESLNAPANKAVESGIPVVACDADLPNSKRVAFVGTGNYNVGVLGAQKLNDLIGGKGKCVVVTNPALDNLRQRVAGYQDTIKAKYPGIQIVQILDDLSDQAKAAEVTSAALQKYPDLAAVICVEAAGGGGSSTAVVEAKKQGTVKIIAMDRSNDICQKIKEGVIQASIAQQTALMPYYSVMLLYTLQHQKFPITTDNIKAGVSSAPSSIDTGVIVVDSKNYELFMRK